MLRVHTTGASFIYVSAIVFINSIIVKHVISYEIGVVSHKVNLKYYINHKIGTLRHQSLNTFVLITSASHSSILLPYHPCSKLPFDSS